MPLVRQIAKGGLIGGAGLLAVVALGLALGFGWLQSDSGRDWLARQIEDAASTPGGMELSIGALTGELPQSLVARDIVLSDAGGPWLTIAALELDWRPWRLLRRTLDVARLELTEVALARLPAAGPETGDEGGGDLRSLLDFPLKLRLEGLAAGEIALGAPVLGQAARFSLSGAAGRRGDGSLAARLDLTRLDGFDERVAATLRYEPQSDSLTAELAAASAPGGLLAAAMAMPELPGADLTLSGSGPLADWNGDLTLSLGDLADAEAAINLQRRKSGDLDFRLVGSSDLRPSPESGLWRLAAGRSEIDLQGAWQDARRLQLDRLAVTNDNLRLDLRGAVEPASGALDLTLSAAAEEADALAELADLDELRSLAATVAVSGSFNRPQATLDLRGEGLAGAEFAAAAVTLSGRLSAERDLLGPAPLLALDLAGRLVAPRLPGQDAVNQVLGEALPVTLAGRLDLATLVLEIEAARATAGPATVAASGPFDLANGTAELDAVAEVAELAALQSLTGITLGGRARLAGPLTLAGFGSHLAADLQGRWEQPSSDIGLIAAAAGDGLDLATRLLIDRGDVRIEQATARSPATQLAASLKVADGGLHDGRYDLRLADAAVLAGELGVATAGPATAAGEIAGPFTALDLNGRATLARLAVEGQPLSDLAATYRLRIGGADIDGPISVALATPFGAAAAETILRLRRDAVTLTELSARLPQTTLSGRITLPLDGGEPAGALTGELADLAPWLELAGLAGGGRGRIAVTLNQPGTAAPLTASADLADVSLQPEPGAAPVTAERLTMELEGQDVAFVEPGTLAMTATALRWDRLALERIDATAQGTASAAEVGLDARGRWIEPLELAAKARVTRQAETVTVSLDSAAGRAFGQPLALRQTATLTLAPEATRLAGLSLSSGDAGLTADAALGNGQVMLRAALDALPLTALDVLWNSGLAGQLTAEVDLQGSLHDPRGTARLTASGLRPRDSRDTPALQLTTTADWRDGRLQAEGELGGAQMGGAQVAAARFSADAPLRMTAEGGIEMPPREPLSGRLDWSGNIKTLLLFVPLPQHRLEGEAEVALEIGGTAAAPRAEGHIALTGGRYENLETGTILADLGLSAEVTEEQVTLASLSATDGAGGRVSGSGGLAIEPARDFPFDLTVMLDKFHAVRRDDVTAVTSGRLVLDGDIGAPRVEGRFTTETVEISLLTDLPPTVVTLDVVEVKNGVVQAQPPAAAEPPPIDALLDIVVEMPRRVFVRGRGLDSEWRGRISVQGPAASPAVTGTLELVRGQLSVVGKNFTLKSGKVSLPEGADSEPALDVTAVHEGGGLTVTARLSGPLSRPELDLSSVPPVPRDEIVSRVLFDKSAAALSAAEAAQLAIALRDLTGKGGGADILGFARRTLGVDVLRIETAEGDAPALEAGKYLTDQVYVGIKQGADSQSTAAGVEVELTPNVTVESEITGKGANKSGIRFQWDY